MDRKHAPRGQVLVLFTLFLLVLLGISALAIDYASWLLTDRALQNYSDHAALAGASAFDDRTSQGSCASGTGTEQCLTARAQAWNSLNNELDLGLSPTMIACLSTQGGNGGNSLEAGDSDSSRANVGGCTSEAAVDFGHTIWVSTPPPQEGRYTNFGGRYGLNFGVVWVRVDRDVRSFLGGALGIEPDDRTGWATAGALPTDFALQTFCRNHIAPESGVCVNSAGVTIDGQGGIRLLRGDVGSNESLTVTSNVGSGVVLESGNFFLVNRTCAPSTWNCPPGINGGISDGVNGKNAFYMAPLPVPHYESPVDDVGDTSWDCSDPTALCIPVKNQDSTSTANPGDWTCSATSASPIWCGAPTVTTDGSGNSSVSCVGQGGGNPPLHYYPANFSSPGNVMNGNPSQSNANLYLNINDDYEVPDPDTTATNPPADYVYSDNVAISPSGNVTSRVFTVNLGQSGPRLDGISTVRYVAFWTDEDATPNGSLVNAGNTVTLQVVLRGPSGTILADPTLRTLTNVPTLYEFTVGANVIPDNAFNSLSLQFTFSSPAGSSSDNALERGGGVSWAGIQHPDPQPAVAPMIPPGYYRSIILPDNACAILDPTAEYSQLHDGQLPGIYRFGGTGSNNDKKIKLGSNSYLIGDGVTLVFDSDWPNAGSNQGIAIGSSGALVLNTHRVPGVPPCTPTETETLSVNMSAPHVGDLPYSAVCAAWVVDTTDSVGVRPGLTSWEPCDTANPDSTSHCTERDQYNPFPSWRGITFYFTPDPNWSTAHGSMNIRNRFEMSGGSGADAGIAFRGILYAPYDDVDIQGGNGFRTVGQVLSWTVKFNGGSAYIDLDYPYEFTPAAPYLLEPTIEH